MAAEKRHGTFDKIKKSALGLAFQSGLYQLTLGGSTPSHLIFTPRDPWPGNANLGNELLEGQYHFAGSSLVMDEAVWLPIATDDEWICEFNSFEWLRDLRSVGGDIARRHARMMIESWIQKNSNWHAELWSGEALSRRVGAWLSLYDFYGASADDQFQAKLFDSLIRQATHLSRLYPSQLPTSCLISAAKALIYADICLGMDDDLIDHALKDFEVQLDQVIYQDGSPISRNPADLLWLLRDLIDIRTILKATDRDIPEALHFAIDKMTPALKFFLHGDGGLAQFNGAQENQKELIATLIAHSDARGTPLKDLPYSGYARTQSGKTTLLVDVGYPTKSGYDLKAHASTFAFEFSSGKERLFVNCGQHPNHQRWYQALASTAAHSTLCLGEANSSQIIPEGGLARRPETVTYQRFEEDGSTLIELSHDGYEANFATLHQRRFFLTDNGEDLRGEEALIGPANIDYHTRFHLHPSVNASLSQDGTTILLKTASGAGWRFKATQAELSLEESVYLGDGDEMRKSQQIVLSGKTRSSKTIIKWAVKRDKIVKK